MKLTLILCLLLTQHGCAVMTVSDYDYKRPSTRQTCTESNWAAGVDLVLASAAFVTGTVLLKEKSPQYEAGIPLIIGAAAEAGSMGYGFASTNDCRDIKRYYGVPTGGGYDWLYAPATVLVVGIIAVAVRGASGGGGSSNNYDQDLCQPYDTPVAYCNDGVYSCSKTRQGTCSWHRGVGCWLSFGGQCL